MSRQAFFKRGAWIIALVLALAAAAAVVIPTDHKDGRRPGWDAMPADWFSRPVRTAPETWARVGPRLTIEAEAAHVVVIPEDRADIAVDSVGWKVARSGADVTLSDGSKTPGFFGRGPCGPMPAKAPSITVRAPRTLEVVVARGAVDGAVGPSQALQFISAGCGRWLLGEVAGPLKLAQSDGGSVQAAGAGPAQARINGQGKVTLGRLRDGLDVYVDGAGTLSAAQVDGRLDVELWGDGAVDVAGGVPRTAYLYAKGAGRIAHAGSIANLTAEAHGKAQIRIGLVTGLVTGLERDQGKLSYARPANRRFCTGAACVSQ